MKRKKQTCVLLIVMFILSAAMVGVDAESQLPKIFVHPPIYTATKLDEVFTIDIKIASASNLQAVLFKLSYNTTILDAIDVTEGPFMKSFGDPVTSLSINETGGYVDVQILLLSYEGPAEGNGTLATITFKATYYGPVSCVLDLYDTRLADPQLDPMDHEVIDGYYRVLLFTLTTDKYSYQPGENVSIYANLTLDVSPIENGSVALEIHNPMSTRIVARTLQTGTPPPPGDITVVEVVPCDMMGNPKSSFKRGTLAYFNVTVINNSTEWKSVAISVNPYDINMVPLLANGATYPLSPGIHPAAAIIPVPIPDWAYPGTGIVYANAFTDWPKNGGVSYCPEKSATFQITNSSQGTTSLETQISGNSSTGNYNLTFQLAPNARNGVYRVYANAFYEAQCATSNTLFGVNVLTVPDLYPTIQEAVDAANSTINAIIALPRTYNEHVTINKTLTLVSPDPSNTIINGSGTGTVITVTANNVEIGGFTIRNSGSSFPSSGITLNNSSGSTISENIISENYYGVYLNSSDNNEIIDNTLSNNNYGIYLNHSTSATLRDNNLVGNKYNFGVFGDSISHFIHDVDTSNTVNGKPIYYWVDQHGREVPADAGYVAIVGSTKIDVRGLDLTKNGQGVLLAFTNDSLIERVNTINNEYGIYMYHSYTNTIIGSALSNNTVDIYQSYCNGNIICHNNFVNNTNQVEVHQSSNTWNDGAGKGNYWSDYTGADDGSGNRTAGDGVGDTLLPHKDVDWYPLMEPWILMHDVAIINVTPVLPHNALWLYPGWRINVNVTVKNEGDFTEIFFNIFAYYDNNLIEVKIFSEKLIPLTETTIDLTWDTTGVSPGTHGTNYTIKAVASGVAGETEENMADNTFTDGEVQVNLPGDVDNNGEIDILDVGTVCGVYALPLSDQQKAATYPFADLDGNGAVNILDVGTVCSCYALWG